MIGLVEDIMCNNDVPYIYEEYTQIVKPEDKEYMSGRGWDYDAIVHYADFQKSDTVLDIGGACSYFSLYLCKYVSESWVIDPIYSYAERWCAPWLKSLNHYKEYTDGKMRIVVQNARKLPFPDNFFDKIVTCSSMEHFENNDDIDCAIEISRVLKPGGLFLGTVDFNWYKEYIPEKYGESRFYTLNSLQKRIIMPSGLMLVGKNYLKDKIAPDLAIFPDGEYKIQTIFFLLAKGLK